MDYLILECLLSMRVTPFLYSINPMVGVIDGFRWTILGHTQLYWPGFILSIGLVALLLSSGLWYFRKTERTFADVI
jgi:lipopolysaccharide transport system permease protein